MRPTDPFQREVAPRMVCRLLVFVAACLAWAAMPVLADEALDDTYNTVIDEAPFGTVRAASMSGAIGPIADDLDAAVHNPAGIGGLRWGKAALPVARKVYFPYVLFSRNKDSQGLSRELGNMVRDRPRIALQDAITKDDKTEVDQAFSAAVAGKRQYVRASAIPVGVTLGRTMIVPFNDQQIAAVRHSNNDTLVDLRIRNLTGLGAGLSLSDPNEKVTLGYFSYLASRRETQGTFTLDDFNDPARRIAVIREHSYNYQGASQNVGANILLGQLWTPTLAIALSDIGDTTWSTSSSDHLVVKQDLAVSLSLSPQLARSLATHLVLTTNRLLAEEVSLAKKYRVGLEFSLGGIGSYATASLRTGYSAEGLAAGASLNLGLIGAELGFHSVDIGAGNKIMIEQRLLGSVFVNVAEF